LEATTKELGTALRAPTAEAGLSPACKDTGFSFLKLQIWERRYDGTKGKVHFTSHSPISTYSSTSCAKTLT
jgi:tocopherol cyclase